MTSGVTAATATGLGSCGELVQGVLADGTAFQVTLPIDLCSTVHVEVAPGPHWRVDVEPPDRRKAAMAARRTAMLRSSRPLHLSVTIESDLPVGAGLGSSTADVVAAGRATAAALGQPLSTEQVGRIAGSIEPSDGTMHPGMCLTDRRGTLLEAWPWAPVFEIVVLVPIGAGVDTDGVDLSGQQTAVEVYAALLDDLRAASVRRDAGPFVAAAAVSAELHHQLCPHPLLPLASDLCRSTGAVGWNVAHTGTALGLLFTEAAAATSAVSTLQTDGRLRSVEFLRTASIGRP